MDVKPQGDSLIVRMTDMATPAADVVAPGGQPQKGIVLAVGEGVIDADGRRIPLEVEAGDEVVFDRYGASAIAIDGEDLLVLHGSDVLPGGPTGILVGDSAASQRLNELDREIETSIAHLRVLAE